MAQFSVTFLPEGVSVSLPGGTILQAQILAGLHPDAPCGGRGTCGKCKVLLNGQEVLACQTVVDQDMIVTTHAGGGERILTEGRSVIVTPDGSDEYAIAFDIGTTTVVGYLLNGHTGALEASVSALNPQGQYGADVISRIQHAMNGNADALKECIQSTLRTMTQTLSAQAKVPAEKITAVAVVGNTAMHHLLLGIDPKPLVTPPYMPAVYDPMELQGARILPNIAGFVGGDTVGCMVSTRFDQLEELTLLIDIGTNGEMVLGNRNRRIACSTAAGPAFEGAKISCGMRGASGAVDQVWIAEDGSIFHHVIGDGEALGLCGSGLLDLVAVLLDQQIIDESGRMEQKEFQLCSNVTLTQKDVREVQLAKAAIRTGIELLCQTMGVQTEDIHKVYLAGAFGNYMRPASACRIGMIPPVLLDRIHPIGNAAGEGAKLCALRREEFDYAARLARETEFLELASLPQFQDQFVDALEFSEESL